MNEKERKILKALVSHPRGELSPVDYINGIAARDERSAQDLISKGYVETVTHPHRDMNGGYYNVPFYRATAKGLLACGPWYKQLWAYFSGDVRTIIVAAITTLITIMFEKLILGS